MIIQPHFIFRQISSLIHVLTAMHWLLKYMTIGSKRLKIFLCRVNHVFYFWKRGVITFSVFSQYITTPINYRLNPLQVSQPFSKPLASPASYVLALLYAFPHIPVVCRLLYASDNFCEAYLFFIYFSFFFLKLLFFLFAYRYGFSFHIKVIFFSHLVILLFLFCGLLFENKKGGLLHFGVKSPLNLKTIDLLYWDYLYVCNGDILLYKSKSKHKKR